MFDCRSRIKSNPFIFHANIEISIPGRYAEGSILGVCMFDNINNQLPDGSIQGDFCGLIKGRDPAGWMYKLDVQSVFLEKIFA
jgi:hypothetical protein